MDLFISWQVITLCTLVYMTMEFIKTVLNVWFAWRSDIRGKLGTVAQYGKELRKSEHYVLTRLVLPSLPPVFGALYMAVLPIRPETLLEYAASHAPGVASYLVYAVWGAFCGQFSDHVYTKIKDAIKDRFAGGSNAG